MVGKLLPSGVRVMATRWLSEWARVGWMVTGMSTVLASAGMVMVAGTSAAGSSEAMRRVMPPSGAAGRVASLALRLTARLWAKEALAAWISARVTAEVASAKAMVLSLGRMRMRASQVLVVMLLRSLSFRLVTQAQSQPVGRVVLELAWAGSMVMVTSSCASASASSSMATWKVAEVSPSAGVMVAVAMLTSVVVVVAAALRTRPEAGAAAGKRTGREIVSPS